MLGKVVAAQVNLGAFGGKCASQCTNVLRTIGNDAASFANRAYSALAPRVLPESSMIRNAASASQSSSARAASSRPFLPTEQTIRQMSVLRSRYTSSSHTKPTIRDLPSVRHFSLSRPFRAQHELSDMDLAHMAAQRQVEATGSTGVLKPMLFTITVSALAWAGAEYYRVNKYYLKQHWRNAVRRLYASRGWDDPYPQRGRVRIQHANKDSFDLGSLKFWSSFTPAQELMLPIIAFCSAVYGLWQYPVFGLRWMYKNFSHMPGSGVSRTLLTSAFSHANLWHLGFNMLALWSFTEVAYPLMGPEYYLATVASGAVVASMAQHVYGTLTVANPALGASGFVFSIVTYVALSYPNNQALLFFIIPAPLLGLLKGLVAFDLIGLTGVWGHFGLRLAHAAHLGGVAVGAGFWWLHQRENRRRLANALPEEVVSLWNKSYNAVINTAR